MSRSKHLRYGGDKINLASSAFVTVVTKFSFGVHPISVEVRQILLLAPKAWLVISSVLNQQTQPQALMADG